ncbi:MAG: S8 family peptidase [Anaerolineae bacterium]|nr:S8 family peptidase [Anaerolineae bacterium]
MKTHFRKMLLLVTLFLLTASLFLPTTPGQAASAAAPPTPADDFQAGELLVKFETDMTLSATENLLSRYQATQIRALYRSDVQLWNVPAGQELEIVASLNANPAVVYAEPNYRYHTFDTTPNDSHFSKQWAHTKIQSPAAWDATTGSNAITIAIIDTGIDEGHPDLASKIVAGYDYVDNDSNPHDLNGHGTHCAGIAAAITNNSTGVAGSSWGARIMPLRVLDAEGSGWSDDITDAITWAYTHGADVLSLSLGGPSYSASMQNAINAAHAAGSLVIAAMGNDRTEGNPTAYPAACGNVMAVAATGPTDTYAAYSQYGSHCDVSAPGGAMSYYQDPNGVYSTMPTYDVYMTTTYGYYKNYDYVQGTSQATPHVAGLAALVWSVNSSLTPDEVQTIIQDNATDLGATGWDSTYGHGRINAFAAVQAARPAAPGLTLNNLPAEGDYVLDWNDVSDAVSYTLEESTSASFTTSFVRYIGTSSVYNVTGQRAGTWYYRVQARNASWMTSDWSNTQSHTVSTLPLNAPPLHNILNLDKDDTFTVTWNTMISATGYILEESSNRYFDAPTQVYNDTGTVHNVTGQGLGTWHYRVRATGATGNSPWSFVKNARVAPNEIFLPLVMRN